MKVTVSVNNKNLQMEVDTGAALSVMSKNTNLLTSLAGQTFPFQTEYIKEQGREAEWTGEGMGKSGSWKSFRKLSYAYEWRFSRDNW